MLSKFCKKDAKKGNFSKQMEFQKKSNKALQQQILDYSQSSANWLSKNKRMITLLADAEPHIEDLLDISLS